MFLLLNEAVYSQEPERISKLVIVDTTTAKVEDKREGNGVIVGHHQLTTAIPTNIAKIVYDETGIQCDDREVSARIYDRDGGYSVQITSREFSAKGHIEVGGEKRNEHDFSCDFRNFYGIFNANSVIACGAYKFKNNLTDKTLFVVCRIYGERHADGNYTGKAEWLGPFQTPPRSIHQIINVFDKKQAFPSPRQQHELDDAPCVTRSRIASTRIDTEKNGENERLVYRFKTQLPNAVTKRIYDRIGVNTTGVWVSLQSTFHNDAFMVNPYSSANIGISRRFNPKYKIGHIELGFQHKTLFEMTDGKTFVSEGICEFTNELTGKRQFVICHFRISSDENLNMRGIVEWFGPINYDNDLNASLLSLFEHESTNNN